MFVVRGGLHDRYVFIWSCGAIVGWFTEKLWVRLIWILLSDDQEFSGGGDDRYLRGFAGLAHGEIIFAGERVCPAGGQGGHVERGANARPSAGDLGAAAKGSALMGMRGQAGQAGDGAAIDAAEFGQLGQQDGRDVRADTRDGYQDFLAPAHGGVAGDALLEFAFDLAPFECQGRDRGAMAVEDQRFDGLLEPRLFHGDDLDDLAPPRRECLEGELLGAGQGPDDIGHGQSKPRDEAGVQPVRLGAVALGVVNPRRIKAFRDADLEACLLYTSPSPRDRQKSRMP